MADIQSVTAEIRRGKNDTQQKPEGKNLMSASATQGQGGHKKRDAEKKRSVKKSVDSAL